MIYVASSWRNPHYPQIIAGLRTFGVPVYDWRDEEGFHWSEVMTPDEKIDHWTEPIPANQFFAALRHARAQQGFRRDMDHLKAATAVVCLLPCGKSAHLEVGWAAGAGKPTLLYAPEDLQPELLYGMFSETTTDEGRVYYWCDMQMQIAAEMEELRTRP